MIFLTGTLFVQTENIQAMTNKNNQDAKNKTPMKSFL